MKRVNLDTATKAVKQFVRGLSLGADGLELELDGKIVCEVIPPRSNMASDRDAVIARGRELAKRARRRNASVPAQVIQREIQDAIDEVRRKNA